MSTCKHIYTISLALSLYIYICAHIQTYIYIYVYVYIYIYIYTDMDKHDDHRCHEGFPHEGAQWQVIVPAEL